MANELILVVDDDLTTVRYCQRLLERASYRVITAVSPLDGLRLIRASHIDLLLSDIVMPDLNGFELIGQAKQIQPDLPVVIMTGHGSLENAILALNQGADGLIIKPFGPNSELTSLVKRVIEEGRQRQDALRLHALRPLFDVSETLLAETSPQTLDNLILQTIKDLFNAPIVGFFILGSDDESMTSLHMLNQREDGPFDSSRLEHVLLSCCRAGTPVIVNVDMHENDSMAVLKELNLTALIATAIQRDSRVVFFAFRQADQPGFTEPDLEMLTIMARQAIVALENARLYTELRDYVKRVEESQQALIQVEKMAAVGRLVASMAHEINNPLQAVRNCLHLAERNNVGNEQRMRYLKMMDIELDRLVNTVKQMLDFYRPGGDDREDVDIHLIVNQVLELLKPQFRDQKIQVHFQGTGQAARVCVATGQIQQVLFNLLINAIEAIQDMVINHSSGEAKNREIWIDILVEHSNVVVTVEDSGPGISPQLQKQVFEPFVSTKPNGTGLGLSVSYGIIERHQGSLALALPKYGHGACFEMKLPSKQEKINGKNINRR